MSTSENQNTLFPKGDRAPADYFTGTAWLKMLVQANDIFNTSIGNVTFEPGTRNNWHKHPGGQILVVTDGVGYYQEKGKQIQTIRRGDVIQIPPDVVHWHGASHNSEMIHLAINTNTQKGIVEWLDRVTDEEYNKV